MKQKYKLTLADNGVMLHNIDNDTIEVAEYMFDCVVPKEETKVTEMLGVNLLYAILECTKNTPDKTKPVTGATIEVYIKPSY